MRRGMRFAIFRGDLGGLAIFMACLAGGLRSAQAAPVITAVHAINISGTDAFIQWTTDVPADEQVDWGPTTAYGSTTSLPPYPTAAYTNHVVHITGLTANTLYHYRAKSNDGTGLTVSGDFTFTAVPQGHISGYLLKDDNSNGIADPGENFFSDPNAPTCPNNDVPQPGLSISFSGTSFLTTTMAACDPATGHPIYSTDLPAGSYTAMVSKPLFPGWSVTSADNVPITITSGGSITLNFALHEPLADTTPPVISNLAVYQIFTTSASVTWDTDEEATAEVDFGTTTAYGGVATETTLTLSPQITMTGLTGGTLYHYRVKSTDQSGNTSTSVDATFTTTGIPCSPPVSCIPMSQYCSYPNQTACSCGTEVCTTPPPQPPAVAVNPLNVTVVVGSSPVFAVSATGDTPITFGWQTEAPGASSFSNVPNSNFNTLTMNNVQLNQNGTQIRCVVSNGTGTATSNAATMTVVSSATIPVITVQPLSQTIPAGQQAMWTASAIGSLPLTYDWQLRPPGGTFTDYLTGNFTSITLGADPSTNGWQVRVIVSNLFGSVISNVATLTVSAPSSACDLNSDGLINVSDVQICVNQAIGVSPCTTGDINKDGVCNIIDVQRDVNAALGGQCVTQ